MFDVIFWSVWVYISGACRIKLSWTDEVKFVVPKNIYEAFMLGSCWCLGSWLLNTAAGTASVWGNSRVPTCCAPSYGPLQGMTGEVAWCVSFTQSLRTYLNLSLGLVAEMNVYLCITDPCFAAGNCNEERITHSFFTIILERLPRPTRMRPHCLSRWYDPRSSLVIFLKSLLVCYRYLFCKLEGPLTLSADIYVCCKSQNILWGLFCLFSSWLTLRDMILIHFGLFLFFGQQQWDLQTLVSHPTKSAVLQSSIWMRTVPVVLQLVLQ